MATPDQVKSQIRFSLEQLSVRNGQHDFEELCLHVARQRICSNVMPATGPVAAGGDQGRDFETFRTHLRESPISQSVFVGLASQKPIAFACSLEQRFESKIKSDVATICGTGSSVKEIHFFSSRDIAKAKRHKLQEWARERHSLHLEIHDGNAISLHLADAETFWIAERYLQIPASIFPPRHATEETSWYHEALQAWQNRDADKMNLADFSAVRGALRHATTEAPADLSFWLSLLEDYFTKCSLEFFQRRARYEITVATMKARGSLFGHEDHLRAYFGSVRALIDPAEVEDVCVLLNLCIAARLHNQFNVPPDEIRGWIVETTARIRLGLEAPASSNLKCRWLDLMGYISLAIDPERPRHPEVGEAFDWWFKLATCVNEAPFFPLEDFADRLTQFAVFLGDHPDYQKLTEQIDKVLAERFGAFTAARKCADRALKFHEAGRIVKAIRELHHAKIQWFAAETRHELFTTLLFIGACYRDLHLGFAAKYYTLIAAFVAIHSEESDNLRKHLPRALIPAAQCDWSLGAWCGFLVLAEFAIRSHALAGDAVGDLDAHPEFQWLVQQTAITMAITERLDASLFGLVAGRVHRWGYGDLLEEMFMVARNGWREVSLDELWKSTDRMAGRPFSDLGTQREVAWRILGIDWSARWANDYETNAAAEEFIAILQIALAEFAGCELCLLPSLVHLKIEVCAATEISSDLVPTEHRQWRVRIPTDSLTCCREIGDYQTAVLQSVAKILRDVSVMANEDFLKTIFSVWEDAIPIKVFTGQRYAKLFRDFVPEVGFDDFDRRQHVVPEGARSHKPPEHPDLRWFSGPGPSYNPEDVESRLRSRYERTIPPIRFTLERLKREPVFREALNDLRHKGWKDWHILLAVMNATINYRVNATLRQDQSPEHFKDVWLQQMHAPEPENAFTVPLDQFRSAELELQLRVSMTSTLARYGLELHQEHPDLPAIDQFLATRYGYWTDDIPHDDVFGD